MVRDSTDRLQGWHDRFARLGIDSPLSHPLYFKKELHIGEDVYKSLRVKKKLLKLLNTLGAAGGGATIASSSTVAATFFPAGILGALGLAAATTPIGWVIGTAVFSGVAWKLRTLTQINLPSLAICGLFGFYAAQRGTGGHDCRQVRGGVAGIG